MVCIIGVDICIACGLIQRENSILTIKLSLEFNFDNETPKPEIFEIKTHI
jgi:hypothetical protein